MSDFSIKQGTDSGIKWVLLNADDQTPFVTTGYTGKAQIRSVHGNLLHEFSSDLGNVQIANNELTLTWTNAETSAWRWEEGRYDLEMTSPLGQVLQVDNGFVTLIKEVTR